MSKRPVLFTTPLIVDALDTDRAIRPSCPQQIGLRRIITVALHTALLYMLWRQIQFIIETWTLIIRYWQRPDSRTRLPAGS